MEEFVQIAFKKSRMYYYLVFALGVLIAGVGYWLNTEYVIEISKESGTMLSTITMMYLIGSIPGALWFFSKKVKVITDIEGHQQRLNEYLKWVKIRLALVGANFIINIALFYTMHATSFLYAAAIGGIAMLFCKPNLQTIDKEINPITEIE